MVSIIIPTYNRADIIHETLDSIVNQSYKDWELILVDDGSDDTTFEILQSYQEKDKRITCCSRPSDKPKGANACRNYGFEYSRGDYILFFDSDDILLDNALKDIIPIMAQHPEYDSIMFGYKEFGMRADSEYDFIPDEKMAEHFPDNFLSREIPVGTQTILMRRSALQDMDMFDERLHKAQDYDFFGRFFLKHPDCFFHPKVLVMRRIHENNITLMYFKAGKREVLSDFYARKKIYCQLIDSNSISNKSFDFLLNQQLMNLRLSINKFYLILSIRIFSHICFMNNIYNKRKKVKIFILSLFNDRYKEKYKDAFSIDMN